jgi:hypothetical protein
MTDRDDILDVLMPVIGEEGGHNLRRSDGL